jgi:hypothetical protein
MSALKITKKTASTPKPATARLLADIVAKDRAGWEGLHPHPARAPE